LFNNKNKKMKIGQNVTCPVFHDVYQEICNNIRDMVDLTVIDFCGDFVGRGVRTSIGLRYSYGDVSDVSGVW
jgi:hypothetical protein